MSNIFPPGAELAGRYRILRLAASQGISSLFEAESLASGERVAFKWLRFTSAQRRFALAALDDAARAARAFSHPNAIELYDVVREGSSLFVVEEFLHGEPLLSQLAPHLLSLDQRLQVLLYAMRAVTAAHASGLVHGALHPGNIFLARAYGAEPVFTKVLDFTIAHFAELECAPANLPLSRAVYRDRDQMRGVCELDARADVYALAVMSYQVLTDRLPYCGDDAIDLASKLAASDAPSAAALRPDLPSAADRALRDALAVRRSARPSSLHDLRAALEDFSRQLPPAAPVARTQAGTELMVVQRPDHQAVAMLETVDVSDSAEPERSASAPEPHVAAAATTQVNERPARTSAGARGLRTRVFMLVTASLGVLGAASLHGTWLPALRTLTARVTASMPRAEKGDPTPFRAPPPPPLRASAPSPPQGPRELASESTTGLTPSERSALAADASTERVQPERRKERISRRAAKQRRRVRGRATAQDQNPQLPTPDQFRAGAPPVVEEF